MLSVVPPTIEHSQAEFKVVQDRSVTFPCRATGVPPPKIHWLKDGKPVSEDNIRFKKQRSGWLSMPAVR